MGEAMLGQNHVSHKVKKCPKCGGDMTRGQLLTRHNPLKHYDVVFDYAEQSKLLTEKKRLVAYACEKCGYVESYLAGNL